MARSSALVDGFGSAAVVSALSADDVREVTLAMGKSVVEVLNGA